MANVRYMDSVGFCLFKGLESRQFRTFFGLGGNFTSFMFSATSEIRERVYLHVVYRLSGCGCGWGVVVMNVPRGRAQDELKQARRRRGQQCGFRMVKRRPDKMEQE